MYNTPASRTSRHGSSKKQRRAKHSQSRPATPVTTSVLPETVEDPMDNAPETKVEALQDEPEGALHVVLGAEPVLDEDGGAEVVQAAESVTNDAMDAWFTETMDAPQASFEEQSFPAILPDLYPDEPTGHPADSLDVGYMLPPHEEVERLQQPEQPAPSEEPILEAPPPGPADFAPTPNQVNEDLMLSINVGAEHGLEENYRTTDHATLPVRNNDVDKPDAAGRLDDTHSEDIEFPPASMEANAGHVRAPIIARRQTNMSTLSRQLKNVQSYLPTSPQLPTFGLSNLSLASFSAPGISNVTVNASGFNRPPMNMGDPFVTAKEGRRRSTGMFADRERLRMTPAAANFDASDDDDASPSTPARRRVNTLSSHQGRDKVEFASFHTLLLDGASRRLLFIGYENGLQIWDTTNLGEVQEILNRRLSGAVIHCGILPAPRTHPSDRSLDELSGKRPLIGIVVEERDTTYLSVYSMATHEVLKKLDFSGAFVTSFQASASFIVVSTSYPSSLHILSTRTLNVLYAVQDRKLILFSRPMPQPNQQHQGSNEPTYFARQDHPRAVFALSHRLLAFAALPPTATQSSQSRSNPHTAAPQSPSIQIGPLNVSQADIGNAALKVGGGLLSGMKALGGFAAAAARGESLTTAYSERSGGFRGLFSRSAPSEVQRHERRYSEYSDITGSRRGRDSEPATPTIATLEERIVNITILDLQPLLDGEPNAKAECLTNFALPAGQSVAGLEFSEDGQALSVIPSDGSVVRMYQIRPKPSALRTDSSGCSATLSPLNSPSSVVGHTTHETQENLDKSILMTEDEIDNEPWHVYDLRRGRTSGVIESLKYSVDNRWVALGTRKRTIHVFATNPYWGKPDYASHLDGRVKNATTLHPLSTELHPIARLRSSHVTSPEHYTVPLAFSFIASSPNSLPAKYLPPPSSFSSPQSVPSSLPASPPTRSRRQSSSSPRLPVRPTNYQDVVVFDPVDGRLSLHRITVVVTSGEGTASILSNIPLPSGTSISLPGMSFMRPSSSPSKSFTPPSQSGLRPEASSELSATTSTIVNWDLMRKKNWKEVNVAFKSSRSRSESRQAKHAKSEWLSQSELSTSSRSPHILPTPLYLSHQFSFFAFGEDYHALLRRLYFDIPVDKIDVRREVEASAYSSGHGELFVAGSSPQEIRNAHAAFDAPLASAISATLDYSGQSPPVIPMLPNGGRPGSFKAAIPIRSVAVGLSEGVNEGFGRLRREIKKVRSPRLRPQTEDKTPGPVPLEFDEDDEVFIGQMEHETGEHDSDGQSAGTSTRGDSGGSISISTPSTNNNAPLPDSEPEGWSLDDMDGLDEEERFDEISTAGFLDEEQRNVPIRVPGQKPPFGRKGR